MKSFILLLPYLLLSFIACEKEVVQTPGYYDCQAEITDQAAEHPRAAVFQELLDNTTNKGIPGMMLTVSDPIRGRWSGAAGMADLAGQSSMESCQITRVGSTVKTFTAVAILRLWERGEVDLDAPVSSYLHAESIHGLANAENATVRQLLQHSSGIDNYILNANFQTASLNDLEKVWQPEELLAYSRGAEATFPLDTDVAYSNTNYVLLGQLIEQVTGRPYYKFFESEIFEPLGLNFTSCAAEDPVPRGIVRGYVDLYSNGNVIDATNFSGWDYFTADGGLISNTYDLNIFLTAVYTGGFLSEAALREMTDFRYPQQSDGEEFRTGYGLGIFRIDTDFGPAFIHSGDAIGYFASMVYFPERQVTVSWAVNGNYGSLNEHAQTTEAMNVIFSKVLE
ncbi:serine hydrolase domain-containing protein [Neolewinella persica]|uniref:serine hydrolase domain-containing protein n=1 Tax=Neolewinella persica TaxID=70998 RepID=UPI000366252A|nr:serine hydrolase domain-containing protein [Neolewinella persica]